MGMYPDRGAETNVIVEPAAGSNFRLSWGAVFAGLLVALSLQLVLTLAVAAVGLAAWIPTPDPRSASEPPSGHSSRF